MSKTAQRKQSAFSRGRKHGQQGRPPMRTNRFHRCYMAWWCVGAQLNIMTRKYPDVREKELLSSAMANQGVGNVPVRDWLEAMS